MSGRLGAWEMCGWDPPLRAGGSSGPSAQQVPDLQVSGSQFSLRGPENKWEPLHWTSWTSSRGRGRKGLRLWVGCSALPGWVRVRGQGSGPGAFCVVGLPDPGASPSLASHLGTRG